GGWACGCARSRCRSRTGPPGTTGRPSCTGHGSSPTWQGPWRSARADAASGAMALPPAPGWQDEAMPETNAGTGRDAYLGPRGTFPEAALAAFDPAGCEDAVPYPSIQATLDAVRAGAAERAIVPIESSVEGAVTATLDELAAGPDLAIQAELLLPVTFALLGREGAGLADIKTVGGHPQAQPQCRRWLAQHLPDAEWLPTSSNAEAARQAADGQIDAALAGASAAGRYGLAVRAAEVNDVPDAVTRFVVVSRPGPVAASTGADRTSLVAFLREDHPGALMELLTEFAVRGINLTRIESRPTGDGLGKDCFSIDCDGHLDAARVGEALMGLRRRQVPRMQAARGGRTPPGPRGDRRRGVRPGGGLAGPPAQRRRLGHAPARPRPGPRLPRRPRALARYRYGPEDRPGCGACS